MRGDGSSWPDQVSQISEKYGHNLHFDFSYFKRNQEYIKGGEYWTVHNTSGEHHCESNKTFSVAHVNTTAQALVHTPVSTVVDQDSRFLQLWVDITIVCNWVRGHTPLVYCQECTGYLSHANHVTFPTVFTVGICTVRYSPPFILLVKYIQILCESSVYM